MHNLQELIINASYLGLFAIIFAESGLLIGFFLPGDSLLFTAGFLASVGIFNLPFLVIILFIAAVLGDNVGYTFGKKVGPKIFKREDSLFFHKDHLEKAKVFYEKHGGKTIVLARFMPIVRTFAPILAGVGTMDYKTFFTFNIIGGALWAIGVPSLGYFLGNLIPGVDKYLVPIIIFIIFVSILPGIIHFYKENKGNIMVKIKGLLSTLKRRGQTLP